MNRSPCKEDRCTSCSPLRPSRLSFGDRNHEKKKDTASHVPALVVLFFFFFNLARAGGVGIEEEKEITATAERHKHKASILKADFKSLI